MDESSKVLAEAHNVIKVQLTQMKRCLVSIETGISLAMLQVYGVIMLILNSLIATGLGPSHGRAQVGFNDVIRAAHLCSLPQSLL
jgi:hypothetical protein